MMLIVDIGGGGISIKIIILRTLITDHVHQIHFSLFGVFIFSDTITANITKEKKRIRFVAT